MGRDIDSPFHFSISCALSSCSSRSSFLPTTVLPGQIHHLRQRSHTRRRLDSYTMNQTNDSTCSSSVHARTAGSNQVQSILLFAPEIQFLSNRKKFLSRNFVISGIARRRISSRIRQSKYSCPNHYRRYLLSNLWIRFHFFHLSQQTLAPNVLSPSSVLIFSSHLCTNKTVRRNHRGWVGGWCVVCGVCVGR